RHTQTERFASHRYRGLDEGLPAPLTLLPVADEPVDRARPFNGLAGWGWWRAGLWRVDAAHGSRVVVRANHQRLAVAAQREWRTETGLDGEAFQARLLDPATVITALENTDRPLAGLVWIVLTARRRQRVPVS